MRARAMSLRDKSAYVVFSGASGRSHSHWRASPPERKRHMATPDGSGTGTWDYGLPGAAVHRGDHICAFFFGVVERDSALLPYLRAGLRGGDRCICIVHASEPSVVLQCIGQDTDIDVHQFVESDQLDVRHANDAYLRTGGFSADAMLNFFNEFVA